MAGTTHTTRPRHRSDSSPRHVLAPLQGLMGAVRLAVRRVAHVIATW